MPAYTIPPTSLGYTFPPYNIPADYNVSLPDLDSVKKANEFIAGVLLFGSFLTACLTCSCCYVQQVRAKKLRKLTQVTTLRSNIV